MCITSTHYSHVQTQPTHNAHKCKQFIDITSRISQTPKTSKKPTLSKLDTAETQPYNTTAQYRRIHPNTLLVMCRKQGGDQRIIRQQKQPKRQHGSTTGPTQRDSSKNQHLSPCQIYKKPNYVHANYLYMPCDLEKAGSNRALFQEGQHTHEPSNTTNTCISNSSTPPTLHDTTMLDAVNNKRHHGESSAEASKRRAAASSEEYIHANQYHRLNLWFGFPVMEQIAKDAGHPPIDLSNINAHLTNGIPQDESRVLANARIAYPRIPQKLWPYERSDGKPSQHYHLTQIPFDAGIIAETGLAKTYQLLLHFERT
jgi:hypothetical protein